MVDKICMVCGAAICDEDKHCRECGALFRDDEVIVKVKKAKTKAPLQK